MQQVIPDCFDWSNFKVITNPYPSTNNPNIVVNSKGGKQSYTPYRYDLIPPETLADVATVLSEGASKYGEWNWLKIDTEDHLNHAIAHIYAHLSGDVTEDHLNHAICRLMFASYNNSHA